MLRWWLDRGVDGFRMDVINLISKVPGLPDGPVAPGETLREKGQFALLEYFCVFSLSVHMSQGNLVISGFLVCACACLGERERDTTVQGGNIVCCRIETKNKKKNEKRGVEKSQEEVEEEQDLER